MAPLTQVKLAALVGVSQPRVSQVLARLSDLDAITSEADGYVGRPDRLIDAYLTAHRPALAAPDMPWYSLRPVRDQVEVVCAHAAHASIARAVSADFAPDLLAAWRHPTLTVVYVDRALNLSRVGFVPAEGRVDATVLVRHTSDPTLLAASEPWPSVVDGIPAELSGEVVTVVYTPPEERAYAVTWWTPEAPARRVVRHRELTAARPHSASIASTKSSSRTLSPLPILTTRQGATGDRLSPGPTPSAPSGRSGAASSKRRIP